MPHSKVKFSHILAALFASMIISLQSPVNADLNSYTDNPLFSAALVFISGLLLIGAIVLFHPKSRQAFLSIRGHLKSGDLKLWHLTGGFTGSLFVIVQSAIVSAVGVALFTVTAVAGQTAGALVTDKLGIGPSGKLQVTPLKLISAFIGVGGVVVTVSGKFNDANFAIGSVALAFVVAVLVASQPAINGQIATRTGIATGATLVNFIGGLTFIGIANLIMYFVDPKPFVMPPMPWENLYIWLGGPFGVIFVLVSAAVAKPLGIFIFTLTALVGQLTSAILWDYFFPTDATDLNSRLFIGLAITVFSVLMASGGNSKEKAKRGTHRK